MKVGINSTPTLVLDPEKALHLFNSLMFMTTEGMNIRGSGDPVLEDIQGMLRVAMVSPDPQQKKRRLVRTPVTASKPVTEPVTPAPKPVQRRAKPVTNVGPDQQDNAKEIAKVHAEKVAAAPKRRGRPPKPFVLPDPLIAPQ